MLDIHEWMKNFVEVMKGTFGGRIVCIGLQGSYGRGEASEGSDIDVVVILDQLDLEDLEKYDEVISKLPSRELVCGFVSGKRELENWEKSDLFQFYYDTEPIAGSLEFLLPKLDREAVRRAVRIGACNIYHMCVHNILHEKDAEILKGLYKSAGFTVQAICYHATGEYRKRKAELMEAAPEMRDRKILETGILLKEKQEISPAEFRQYSRMLMEWSGRLIMEYSEAPESVPQDFGTSEWRMKDADVVRETSAYRAGKRQGEYTLEDYYAIPDEQRVELIDGVIYDMAAPSNVHQMLSDEILVQLKQYVKKKGGQCVPMSSPVDVQLDCDNKTMVQPDVLVTCDREKIKFQKIYGAPDFVIEILSKSTRKKDLCLKLAKYMQAGVREYWIVDPDKKYVFVYDFEHGAELTLYTFQDTVPVQIFHGECQVDFSEIYENVRFLYEKQDS